MSELSEQSDRAPVVASVNDGDRAQCECEHKFCEKCLEVGECCKCYADIPPRTVVERLAQHDHIEIVATIHHSLSKK